MVVVFVIIVVVALLLLAGAAVALIGSRRRREPEEPHARALEALGRIQQSRREAPRRPAYPNTPARPSSARPSSARPSSARPSPAQPNSGRAAPRRRARRRSPGVLPWAVAALVVLNLVAGAVLALALTNPNQKSPTAGGTHPPSTKSPISPVTSTTAPADRVTSSTVGRSSSLPSPPPGAGPVIAAISPASGVAGQVVTLTGTGLFSADGVITVMFGSALASVQCPTENTCHATVPTRATPSSGTVSVTVKTESGTSNKVAFSYA